MWRTQQHQPDAGVMAQPIREQLGSADLSLVLGHVHTWGFSSSFKLLQGKATQTHSSYWTHTTVLFSRKPIGTELETGFAYVITAKLVLFL